jgi:predicted amidohydrolase
LALQQQEPIPEGPTSQALAAIARDTKVAVAVGVAEVDVAAGKRYNTLLLVGSNGHEVVRYRKVHLRDSEATWASPGDGFLVAEYHGTRLGGWICCDTRFAASGRSESLAGAALALVATAWLGPDADWELLLRARAADIGLFVAASALQGPTVPGAASGSKGNVQAFQGGSMIVGPRGQVLASLPRGVEGVVCAELDLAEHARWHAALPVLADCRRHQAAGRSSPGWAVGPHVTTSASGTVAGEQAAKAAARKAAGNRLDIAAAALIGIGGQLDSARARAAGCRARTATFGARAALLVAVTKARALTKVKDADGAVRVLDAALAPHVGWTSLFSGGPLFDRTIHFIAACRGGSLEVVVLLARVRVWVSFDTSPRPHPPRTYSAIQLANSH